MDIYCINLESRPDRLELLKASIEELGLPFNIIRVDAVPLGRIGCGLSHKKAVRHAKDTGMDQIIVVEDDVLFHRDSYEYLQQSMAELPDDWDILVGGVIKSRDSKKIEGVTRVLLLDFFNSTHFMVYRRSAYDTVLNWTPVDERGKNDIDIFLSGTGLKIYVSVPFIATQRNGVSDIRGSHQDYTLRFQRLNIALLKKSGQPYRQLQTELRLAIREKSRKRRMKKLSPDNV